MFDKSELYEQEKLLDLTSAYYDLPEKDKEYISKYYRSLLNDLMMVTLDVRQNVEGESDKIKNREESTFDLESFFLEKRDYAVKTIAHMITLLDFAAGFCIDVRDLCITEVYVHSLKEWQKQSEKIFTHTELFIGQLGEDVEEALWDYLMINIEEIVLICHENYAKNLNLTIQSVRKDYPDFANRILFLE